MSEWAKINGFDYSVNRIGQVRHDGSGCLLKTWTSSSGYLYVQLIRERAHTRYVHRLIGEAFIPNPENLPQIDHIDGNKQNNDISNLRWVSVSENRTAYGNAQRAKSRMREVVGINEHGEKVVFESRKAVAERFGCSPSKVKYGHKYTRSEKKGWIFYKVEDIV